MRFRAAPFYYLSLTLLLAATGIRGEESQLSGRQLKAAFLFNFAKFTEWPATVFTEEISPVVIGILGENPFGEDLEKTLHGKFINKHPLVIKEFRSPQQATNCHVLFISPSEKGRLPEILEQLRGASVLTVGETNQFIQDGGMINFVMEGNKIRFQINNDEAVKAGLKISSRLLSLATSPTK
jgi:hypothetical protein